MHNTAFKEALINAGVVRDTATGGVRPISPEEQERIRKFTLRYAHRFNQPDLMPSQQTGPAAPVPEPVKLTPEQEQELDEIEEQAEKHNPFEGYLKGIEGHLLDAKNRIAFTLEQSRKREREKTEQMRKLGEEVIAEQIQIEALQSQLSQIEDTMAGANLLSEQALQIAPLLSTQIYKETVKPEATGKIIRPRNNDPTICRRSDVTSFFEENQGKNWTAAEIRENMPPVKRAHAKKSMNVILAELTTLGRIRRVGQGIYRMDKE